MKKFLSIAFVALCACAVNGCGADIPADEDIKAAKADPEAMQRAMKEMVEKRAQSGAKDTGKVSIDDVVKQSTGEGGEEK